MAAHAAAADDDDKGSSEFVEALGGQEHAVARELLQHQLIVEVAGLGAPRERFGAEVFFVGSGNRSERGQLSGREEGLLVISSLSENNGH